MKKKNRFWSRLVLVLSLVAAAAVFTVIALLAGGTAAWAAVTALLWLTLVRLWWSQRSRDSSTDARLDRQRSNYESIISMLCGALELSDNLSTDHSQRVSHLASAIAVQMGLREREVRAIQKAAVVHDVGRIALPRKVLNKPGPLTRAEWEEMRRHSQMGADVLKEITDLRDAAAIINAHHERFDGGGYPHGLAGDKIPLASRIFAVADSYVAMTSRRPYRMVMLHAKAIQEIVRNSGAQFDPDVVMALIAAEKRGLLEPEKGDSGLEGALAGVATAEARA